MKTVLKGAFVYAGGTFSCLDVLISDGVINFCPIGTKYKRASIIDCSKKYIFPGLIDVHVHFREPGFSYKETIKSGSSAAAHGGFTSVCVMPNIIPCPDSLENLSVEEEIIDNTSLINVFPYGSITKGQNGKTLSDIKELSKKVVAFSDDGKGVEDTCVAENGMKEISSTGKIYAEHCEYIKLRKNGIINEGEYSRSSGLRGIPNESEFMMLKRDLELSNKTGCKFHVCHISTKESVDLIRNAKSMGVDVTCETAAHYICFDDDDLEDKGEFKMNPPIGSIDDKEALIKGICDGTIDMIASDHAPHSKEEKNKGLLDSLMGVSGIEVSFSALYTQLVKTNIISLCDLLRLMHDNPKSRFGIGNELTNGSPADLTVFDLDSPFVVDSNNFISKGKCTPFNGKKLFGDCLLTLCGGRIVWKKD